MIDLDDGFVSMPRMVCRNVPGSAPASEHAPCTAPATPYTRHARRNQVGKWVLALRRVEEGKEVARLTISPYPSISNEKEYPKSFSRFKRKYPGVCSGPACVGARGTVPVVQASTWH